MRSVLESPVGWWIAAGIWGGCTLLCLLIGWQELRRMRHADRRDEAPVFLQPLDLDAARERRAMRRRAEARR